MQMRHETTSAMEPAAANIGDAKMLERFSSLEQKLTAACAKMMICIFKFINKIK